MNSSVEYMQDSFDGLRPMIGRNVIVDADLFEAIAFVEHCRNPDQLDRGFSDDERKQAECQSRLWVTILHVEIGVLPRDDATCELDFVFASPFGVDRLYGIISTPRCLVNSSACCRSFRRGILPNLPVGWKSTQTIPISWKLSLSVNMAML